MGIQAYCDYQERLAQQRREADLRMSDLIHMTQILTAPGRRQFGGLVSTPVEEIVRASLATFDAGAVIAEDFAARYRCR